MIRLVSVCKKFGQITALNDVTLDIDRSITAVIGPNGAGKTTLVRLILGLLKPTSGEISVMGVNPASERDKLIGRIAYVPERVAVYERMTAHEYLKFFASIKGLEVDINEILARYGLIERAEDKISKFSKGMKRRLEIARAFMSEPEILVLDEPFSGIDPESRADIRKLIRASRSKIVIVCSHDLHEIEQVADSVIILRSGKALFHGSIENLLAKAKNVKFTIRGVFDTGVKEILSKFETEIIELGRNHIILSVRNRSLIPAITRELSSQYDVFEVTSHVNLERIFMEMFK